jgi:DNA-binding GntR family transcriptional regulator
VARYGRACRPAVLHAAREIAGEQQAIVAALRAGSEDGAEQCVALHWRRSLDRFRGAMGRIGEQGTW